MRNGKVIFTNMYYKNNRYGVPRLRQKILRQQQGLSRLYMLMVRK